MVKPLAGCSSSKSSQLSGKDMIESTYKTNCVILMVSTHGYTREELLEGKQICGTEAIPGAKYKHHVLDESKKETIGQVSRQLEKTD